MAYARWGEGSDVYVFASSPGFHCQACSLGPGGSYIALTRDSLIEHLARHRICGDAVPDQAFERLYEERAVTRTAEVVARHATGEWFAVGLDADFTDTGTQEHHPVEHLLVRQGADWSVIDSACGEAISALQITHFGTDEGRARDYFTKLCAGEITQKTT